MIISSHLDQILQEPAYEDHHGGHLMPTPSNFQDTPLGHLIPNLNDSQFEINTLAMMTIEALCQHYRTLKNFLENIPRCISAPAQPRDMLLIMRNKHRLSHTTRLKPRYEESKIQPQKEQLVQKLQT